MMALLRQLGLGLVDGMHGGPLATWCMAGGGSQLNPEVVAAIYVLLTATYNVAPDVVISWFDRMWYRAMAGRLRRICAGCARGLSRCVFGEPIGTSAAQGGIACVGGVVAGLLSLPFLQVALDFSLGNMHLLHFGVHEALSAVAFFESAFHLAQKDEHGAHG